MHTGNNVPLKVLICDIPGIASNALEHGLSESGDVLAVRCAENITAARTAVQTGKYNTIFVDPLVIGLEEAAAFIFETRQKFPELVFVLYLDRTQAEQDRAEFYRGDRRRFSHYFKLDKQTPVAAFAEELTATIERCQSDLALRLSSATLDRLQREAAELAAGDPKERALLNSVQEGLSQLLSEHSSKALPEPKTVFLSYRFAEDEYVKGLTRLLQQSGFQVVDGKSANTYVSLHVIEEIRKCTFFLSLMTCCGDPKRDGTFATSGWLLEEKGVALALGKPPVLMVEAGVSDYGGLEGNWQKIYFKPKEFLDKALEAVDQLKSYVGAG